MNAWPERTREYRSYIFDSRSWDRFVPRDGDIVITTSYKSGTTWMQNIVLRLIFQHPPRPPVSAVSPWLDRVADDPGAMLAALEGQRHRRIIKSHLPLDGVPFLPELRYIVVVRDARDVFMSFWNHYSAMTDAYFERMLAGPLLGPPMPRCPEDIHALWPLWTSRGWFEWQTEGWPHSGNLYHTASWWPFRHLPNILFVHFADLLATLEGEIARIAAFLGVPLSDEEARALAGEVGFEALRERAAEAAPVPESRADFVWKDGLRTFFHRGTNGRWRKVLGPEELMLYEAAKARCLTPDCAAYLEGGRAAWSEAGPSRSAKAASTAA